MSSFAGQPITIDVNIDTGKLDAIIQKMIDDYPKLANTLYLVGQASVELSGMFTDLDKTDWLKEVMGEYPAQETDGDDGLYPNQFDEREDDHPICPHCKHYQDLHYQNGDCSKCHCTQGTWPSPWKRAFPGMPFNRKITALDGAPEFKWHGEIREVSWRKKTNETIQSPYCQCGHKRFVHFALDGYCIEENCNCRGYSQIP